jgi:two-component system, sensor histidine kinase and response regulator
MARMLGAWQQYGNAVITRNASSSEGASGSRPDILVAGNSVVKVSNSGLPTVDADELMERLDGDRQLLIELTDIFRRDYPQQLELIRQAIAQENAIGLTRASHALKGALSSLSACEAREIAASLEEMGTTGNLQHARAGLHDLEGELVKAVESLAALCREAGQ